MMFTGYRVPGPELYRLGVVEACVPDDELMDVAMGFAREIASKSPAAIVLAKQALNTIEEMSLRDGYRFEQNMTVSVESYIGDGGRILVSGSELGWALDNLGEADEQAFYREVLRAVYVADDAEIGEATLDGVLGALGPLSFEDPSTYTPRFPDVLEPARGAETAMVYADGLDSVAAVSWDDGDARGVTMGFPFETIDDATTRTDVMAAVLAFFDVVEEDGPDPGGTGGMDTDDGVGDSSGGNEGGGSDDGGGTGGGGTDGGDTDAVPGADGADDGCGCRHGGDGGAGLVLLLGLLGLRRRRS